MATKKYKFGEKTKSVTVRVPESKYLEYRILIQKTVNNHFNGVNEPTEKLRRLYDIMNAWMLGKMNNDQIENIPESVIEEIEEIEESLNVHNV